MGEARQELGLEVLWRAALAARLEDRPRILGDQVVVRVGSRLLCLAAATGEVAWNRTFEQETGAGTLAVDAVGLAVNHPLSGGVTRLSLLDPRGEVRWQKELPGQVLRGGLWFHEGRLWMHVSRQGSLLRVLDPADGRVLEEITVRSLAPDAVLHHPRGLLLRSSSATADLAGLAVLARENFATGHVQKVRDGRVWSLATVGDQLFLTHGEGFRLCTLEARAFDTLELLWSRPDVGSAIAAGAEGIAVILLEGGQRYPALLDAGGQDVLWRGNACEWEVTSVAIEGPVLLVREQFRLGAWHLPTGRFLGDGTATYSPAARWQDRIVLGADSDLVCLALPPE